MPKVGPKSVLNDPFCPQKGPFSDVNKEAYTAGLSKEGLPPLKIELTM